MLNRRSIMMATIAALAAPSMAAAQAARGVRVDVSALRRQGMGGQALAVIEQAVQRELAGYVAGRGGSVTVRIDSLWMSPYAGGDRLSQDGGVFGGGGGANDYMAGEIIRTDAAGRVVTRFPMHNALPSSSGGAWYGPDVDLRRMDALATHFARWAARQAG
ncbi:MAG: hypothetical protein ACRCXM_07295 [Beijerinckiaceae bacterium]